jgi:gluconokinase
MTTSIVIMGVAGCGKSSLGAALATALGARLVEGDDHHSPANRAKMAEGVPLTDADRAGWLAALADVLQAQQGASQVLVMSCSALKHAYRERLRAAAPGLRFAFLALDRDAALARVSARAATHFFSSTLVDSQFATLESPTGEPGVLTLDALLPLDTLTAQVRDWLQSDEVRA